MAERDRQPDLAGAYSEITTWLRALAAPLLANPADAEGDADGDAAGDAAGEATGKPLAGTATTEPPAPAAADAPSVTNAPPAAATRGGVRGRADRAGRGRGPSSGVGTGRQAA